MQNSHFIAGKLYEISPDLELRISPRAKRLTLRLDPQKRKICLVVPKRASLKAAYEFARTNKNWIDQKLNTLPRAVLFHDGDMIPLLGKTYRLTIDHDDIYKTTRVQFEADRIVLKTSLSNYNKRIERFIKKLAHDEFGKLARQKASRIDQKIKVLTLRDMRTRWGSCSKDGRMSLNWRLIFAPYESYDYVIAHEVAHLIHADHGKNFWKLCETLSTDFTQGKKWISLNANELTRYVTKIPQENAVR